MNLSAIGESLSLGEMVLIGGLTVKVIWEVFTNRQQSRDIVVIKDEQKALRDYVTNGSIDGKPGLASKYIKREECPLLRQAMKGQKREGT